MESLLLQSSNTSPFTPNTDFHAQFLELLKWRRDVRHFRTDPVAPELLDALLMQARMAPDRKSVV